MMVKGTREGDSEMILVASVSILVESTTGQCVDAVTLTAVPRPSHKMT